jgi:hypothetical protein
MAGKLFMYNPEQQQFVERGYGVLKINESHDPTDWNKLHARLSKTFIQTPSLEEIVQSRTDFQSR